MTPVATDGRTGLADLVKAYFQGVDDEDLPAIEATMHADCVFTVETHGVRLQGREEIAGMFRRLWGRHRSVSHSGLRIVADPSAGRVAAQFGVVNTLPDGKEVRKSNCNFFTVRDGLFSEVNVYMAGENTLDRAG